MGGEKGLTIIMSRIVRNAKQELKHYWKRYTISVGILALLLVSLTVAVLIPRPFVHAQAGDWPTFFGDDAHTGFNGAETSINPTTAPNLKQHWVHKAAGKITTQPTAANGMLYWGSWDGIEHASRLSDGTDVWATSLGQTMDCRKNRLGVFSTATIASAPVNGVSTTVDFVAGGDNNLYALDANSGMILWNTQLGSPPNSFLYSSPTVFNGSVYIGVSGNADCSRVQGQLVQVDTSTGTIQHTFNVVPNGCLGGSVWTSPTINETTGMLYVSTAEPRACSSKETNAEALVALHAADLSLAGVWQVPASETIQDGDFGASPTLFTATINGVFYNMVGLSNKSGFYYAFDQSNISAGPLWHVRLATAPGPSMSSSAWDGTTLYVAAGPIVPQSTSCPGTLWALNPADGSSSWQDCLNFDVRGGVTAVPGLVEAGVGSSINLYNATTGKQLFGFQDAHKQSNFEGPGSISNGVLYQGNLDGFLYAFGL